MFGEGLPADEYRTTSRSLHDLVAYQLKHQNHLSMTPRIIEEVMEEHRRFRQTVAIPDHAFTRVENLLRTLKLLAESNYQHSLRMEKQASNIQSQLIDLTSLEIASQIRENSRIISLNTGTVDRLIREVGKGLLQPQPQQATPTPQEDQAQATLPQITSIAELVSLSRKLSETSAHSLDAIKKTNKSSRDTIAQLHLIAQTGEQQRDYLQNVATLSFWALPLQIFTGFVSMGLFDLGEKEGAVRWASMLVIGGFVGILAWFGAQAVVNSRRGGLDQLWWRGWTLNGRNGGSRRGGVATEGGEEVEMGVLS